MPKFSNFKLKVISKAFIAPTIILLKTKADQEIHFLAGQYFSFKIEDKVNRSYSTASAPEEESIDFVIDIAPGGPGSIFVQNLQEGGQFDVMGPFGFFNLEKAGVYTDEEPLIFAATGTGIAPMRSMVVDLLKNTKTRRPLFLYFGLRFYSEAYYHEELEELSKEYSNFTFIPVISRPDSDWSGECGYCQDIIMRLPIIEKARVFVCGRSENVKSISDALVAYGYPKENVHFEKFG